MSLRDSTTNEKLTMNVLLTGGAGYIGSHTYVQLVDAGHRVILFDNLCNSNPSVADRLEEITRRPTPLIKGDMRDTALVAETLRLNGISAVIHLAGLKDVGASTVKPIDYYSNNVQGTISLLQAMQVAGVRSLVFSSSATVYGEPKYLPIDEEHPTGATNPYGRSKLQVEEILADLARSDDAWRIICLRYFNPVGAHGSGLIGEDPTGIPGNLMPYLVKVASGQLPFVKVFGTDYPTPDGTGVRDYIHVVDLADGHLAALNFLNHNAGCHTFNLGTGVGYSVFELIGALEAVVGKVIPFTVGARRIGDVATCYANADKATSQLGWSAQLTLANMCTSAWLWQCTRTNQD